MRRTILVALLAAGTGCQNARQPQPITPSPSPSVSAPPPSGSMSGFIWGYVLGADQRCINGAVVEIIDSSDSTLIGRQSRQESCDFDDGIGWSFRDFAFGARLSLRASKVGYRTQAREIVA